nr:PTS sugar transporter subunit IIA [Dissulfurirhabdus thermomarina]
MRPEHVLPELAAGSKPEVLRAMAAHVAAAEPGLDPERVYTVLMEREALGSTGIGEGVAIPHGKIAGLDRLVISVARSPRGVEFDAVDRQPVRLLFLLLAPEAAATAYLRLLARVSRLMKSREVRQALLGAGDVHAILATIREADVGP